MTDAPAAVTHEHMALVRSIAARLAQHLPPHIDVDDLVGDGCLGLLDALAKFDPQRGAKFETYAYTRIRGAMVDGMRRMRTDDEDGQLPLSLEEIWRTDADGEVMLADTVADPRAVDPEQAACEADLARRVAAVIAMFPPLMAHVARDRIAGIAPKHTAAAISRSVSRVSQLSTTAQRRLRVRLRAQGVQYRMPTGTPLIRDRAAFAARVAEGAPWEAIEAEFGVSKEKARQYCWRNKIAGPLIGFRTPAAPKAGTTADILRVAIPQRTPRRIEGVPEPAPTTVPVVAASAPPMPAPPTHHDPLGAVRAQLAARIADLERDLAEAREALRALESVEAVLRRSA